MSWNKYWWSIVLRLVEQLNTNLYDCSNRYDFILVVLLVCDNHQSPLHIAPCSTSFQIPESSLCKSLPVGNLMYWCCKTCTIAAQVSCTMVQTMSRVTPKRCPIVRYSVHVPRHHNIANQFSTVIAFLNPLLPIVAFRLHSWTPLIVAFWQRFRLGLIYT